MRKYMAVGAMPVLLAALTLQSCDTEPHYAEKCDFEGGTARWVPGSSPIRGYCDHPGPDDMGTPAEIDVCTWISTERGWAVGGTCTFVASESNTWAG